MRGAAGSLAAAALAKRVRAATPDRRLNVLMLVADDQRSDMIAAQGNRLVRTPTLDLWP